MATFTMELCDVVEEVFGSTMDPEDFEQEYKEVNYKGVKYGKLPTVPDWSKLGLGTYPIFDENYREVLNGKILDEYFKREIGVETIDLFVLNLRKKMDQIMPYYNKLYQSETIEFDPLATMDIKTEGSSSATETNSTTGTASTGSEVVSGARAVSQEMPQTMLASNGDYATSATDTNSKTNTNGTSSQESLGTIDNSGNTLSRTTGFQGVASELLIRYRNSLLNIDISVLSEIQEMFMIVLNNGDAYTQRGWYW